jgi:DNA excision repair protein ERCC-2
MRPQGAAALADHALLDFYWELLHFQALADQFGPHALFDIQLATPLQRASRVRTPASTLCIRNVVPAPHLAARHEAAQATVLFSGTLSPPQFYRDLLGLPAIRPGWMFRRRLRPGSCRCISHAISRHAGEIARHR